MQLSFGNVRPVRPKICIVFECCPGYRVVTVAKTQETAGAHHGVDDPTGELLDQQVVDLTDRLIASAINICSLNILISILQMIWVCVAWAMASFLRCRSGNNKAEDELFHFHYASPDPVKVSERLRTVLSLIIRERCGERRSESSLICNSRRRKSDLRPSYKRCASQAA